MCYSGNTQGWLHKKLISVTHDIWHVLSLTPLSLQQKDSSVATPRPPPTPPKHTTDTHAHTHVQNPCVSRSVLVIRAWMFCTQIHKGTGSGVKMKNCPTFSSGSNDPYWDRHWDPLCRHQGQRSTPLPKQNLVGGGLWNIKTLINARLTKGRQRIKMLFDTWKRICQML